jgi:hypothetical protein
MKSYWHCRCVLLVAIVAYSAAAQDSPATQPAQASREHRDQLIPKARARMAEDRKKYSPQQLAEAEKLYQVANQNWRSEEATASLKLMIEKYPDVNRTGCAALYLAQYTSGAEQEAMLKNVIEKYSDCWYLNGAQVGALARLLLAQRYWAAEQQEAARELFDQIKRDYPGAITHRGLLISDVIERIESQTPSTQPGRGW